jgi:hypothetical protein
VNIFCKQSKVRKGKTVLFTSGKFLMKLKLRTMSDEEEDYMSDTFLAKLEANDVRPSLIKNQTVKRKNEIESKRKEVNEKRHKPVHVIQKEKLKEGLNKALSEDNKGFKMLQKMGFQSGSSLGKSSSPSAIKEPIKLNFNNAGIRSGLGTVTETKERTNLALDKLKQTLNSSNLSPEEFRQQLREQNESKQVLWDLHKLQKTCRIIDLEHRIKFPIHPWFWPEERGNKDDEDEKDNQEDKNKNSLSVSFLSHF